MKAAQRRTAEIATGFIITIVMVLFLSLVFGGKEVVADGRYPVQARFNRVDGLAIGADVRLAGITIGTVSDLQLDADSRAVAVLRLDSNIELDSDATAAIITDGLFGAKIVEVDIGGGEDSIEPGGEIVFTEESMILDDLLDLVIQRGRQVHGVTGDATPE